MDKIPADAIIITDGYVSNKTLKNIYDATGKELSSELIAFEVMPNFGAAKVKSVTISYNKTVK
jgi:hypothetical protein